MSEDRSGIWILPMLVGSMNYQTPRTTSLHLHKRQEASLLKKMPPQFNWLLDVVTFLLRSVGRALEVITPTLQGEISDLTL